MISGALMWLSIPMALFIGSIGAISVFKAIYIDKRNIKCACIGGDSKVPLGLVSLTEDFIMVAMAVWMQTATFAISSSVRADNPMAYMNHATSHSMPRSQAASTRA